MMDYCSATRITADSVIGDSGRPVALHGFMIESGATAAVVIFRNGTSASATEIFRTQARLVSSTDIYNPAGGRGIVFPSGLFVDIDANTTSFTAFWTQLTTA